MATVSRIYGEDFKGYLTSLRQSADEMESPAMKNKLKELCAGLEPLVHRLSQNYPWPGRSDEAEKWVRKLDDLQGSLAACTTAQGVGSMCRPFYDDVEKLLQECRETTRESSREA
jgi:hypothetical protein